VTETSPIPFREMITKALDQYFKDLNGETPVDLYEMVLVEVEKPLLEIVLRESKGNLSLAAKTLGINRGTLRTRLQKYGLKNK
jgi:Fis family transcriptional regulator, factor for inversion stimulation protein